MIGHSFLRSSLCVAGVWLGLLISVLAQSVFFSVYLYKMNWEKASEEVRSSSKDSHVSHRHISVGATSLGLDFNTAEFLLNRHRKEQKSRFQRRMLSL